MLAWLSWFCTIIRHRNSPDQRRRIYSTYTVCRRERDLDFVEWLYNLVDKRSRVLAKSVCRNKHQSHDRTASNACLLSPVIRSPLRTLIWLRWQISVNKFKWSSHIIWLLVSQYCSHQRGAIDVLLRTPNVPRVFAEMQIREYSDFEGTVGFENEPLEMRIWIQCSGFDKFFTTTRRYLWV